MIEQLPFTLRGSAALAIRGLAILLADCTEFRAKIGPQVTAAQAYASIWLPGIVQDQFSLPAAIIRKQREQFERVGEGPVWRPSGTLTLTLLCADQYPGQPELGYLDAEGWASLMAAEMMTLQGTDRGGELPTHIALARVSTEVESVLFHEDAQSGDGQGQHFWETQLTVERVSE